MAPSSLLVLLALAARAEEPGAAVPATPEDLQAYQVDALRYAGGAQRFLAEVKEFVGQVFDKDTQEREKALKLAKARRDEERSSARLKAMRALESYLCTYAPDLVAGVNECTKPPAPRTVRARDIVGQGLRLAQLYVEAETKRYNDSDKEMKADFSRPVAMYERLLATYPTDPELDGAYDGLASCLSFNQTVAEEEPAALQSDLPRARELREALLARYPNSTLTNKAHFWLGEHYILREDAAGDVVARRKQTTGFVEEAARHYAAVVAQGPSNPSYDVALFKFASANFLLAQSGVPGKVDVALSFIEQTIDRGDRVQRPRALNLLKEVYINLWSMRVDEGDTDSPFKDVVLEHVARVGDRPWARELVVLGAHGAWEQLATEDAVALFAYLQERWPNHPSNPVYQYNIASILRNPVNDGQDKMYGWVVASDGLENAESTTSCRDEKGNVDALCESLVALGATRVTRPVGTKKPAEAIAALEALNSRYGRKSAWAVVNQGEAAARERSAALIRAEAETLIAEKYNVAVAAYEPIVKLPPGATPPPELLAASRAAWAHYVEEVDALLDANPALRTPRRQFELGQGAYLAAKYDDAIRRFDALVADPSAASCRTGDDADPGRLCVEEGRVLAWKARRELLVAEVGGDAQKSPGYAMSAEGFPTPILVEGIESEEITPFGKSLKRLALPARASAFMKATDAHLAHPYTEPTIVSAVASDRLTLAYQLAQLDFAYGRFNEARARFMAVMDAAPPCTNADPTSCVELLAANLYLKTWELAGDGEQVALAAAQFSARFANRGGGLAAEVSKFKDIEQGRRFKLIDGRDPMFSEDPTKRVPNPDPDVLAKLAAEYIAFAESYPAKPGYRGGGDETGKDAPAEIALGRACALLGASGRVDDSLKTTELFVSRYPLSPFAAGFYWQLAESADKAFVQADAVKWYQTFADETAKNAGRRGWGAEIQRLGGAMVDTSHAYANIAVLREAMDAPAATAAAWEVYATRHAPASTDAAKGLLGAEGAFWRARDFWRESGDAELAKFYERYLKQRFAVPDVSNTVVAWDELAALYERRGDKRNAQTARASAAKAYQSALAAVASDPAKVVTKDAHAIGMKDAMAKLEAEWKATQPAPWPKNSDRAQDMLTRLLLGKEIERVTAAASTLTASPDFDAQQMGGYYLGLAWARYAALLRTDRASPLNLATAFPINAMGLEDGSPELSAIEGLLRDGDADGNGTPDLIGSEAAEKRASDLAEATYLQAVAPPVGLPRWSVWTSRTLELLALELRTPGYSRDRAVMCGENVCGSTDVAVSVDTVIAPIKEAK